METIMIRAFLIAALIAPALCAQTPEQRLEEAWAHYLQFDIVGGAGEGPQAGLGDAMDELGRAWAAWVEWRGPGSAPLPGAMNFRRSEEPDTLTPPINRTAGHYGPWTLVGLEVPAPCGTHLFVALFKTQGSRWRLVMLDLHEPRTDQDPLGAREGAQALLLKGPKVVIASTPPWCTSCWSRLHVRALAPGADAEHPKALAHFDDDIYRCADDGMLKVTPLKGGIRLRYEGATNPPGATAPRMETLRIP